MLFADSNLRTIAGVQFLETGRGNLANALCQLGLKLLAVAAQAFFNISEFIFFTLQCILWETPCKKLGDMRQQTVRKNNMKQKNQNLLIGGLCGRGVGLDIFRERNIYFNF